MTDSRSITPSLPVYIPETDDIFVGLWPHRWDFISAPHPHPEKSPLWATESRYPLSDRELLSNERLSGVRFGADSAYFMLDIDRSSPYHPARDRFAVGRILDAFESLGVTDLIAVTSSYRGGLHLYFPLPNPEQSWKLAAVVERCLLRAGFYVGPGILECFPNTRRWASEPLEAPLFMAHRLPLQRGSYLLNDDWQMIHGGRGEFVRRWRFAAARNAINRPLFNLRLKESTERKSRLTYKAKKFLSDLCHDIEGGWTGTGQTNVILGRVAMREYIFGHVTRGGDPLTGDRLTAAIVDCAVKLPGYSEHCRHRSEIWARAEHWARAIEKSKYYPYQSSKPDRAGDEGGDSSGFDWNCWQETRARERVTFAIADMLNRGTLPGGIRERFHALIQGYGFSGETLYRHKDLWHPDHLWKTPPAPPNSLEDSGRVALREHPARSGLKLIDSTDRNIPQDKGLRPFWELDDPMIGGNTAQDKGLSNLGPDHRLRGGPE